MIDVRTREFGIRPLAFLKTSESPVKSSFRRVAILVLEFLERLLDSPNPVTCSCRSLL